MVLLEFLNQLQKSQVRLIAERLVVSHTTKAHVSHTMIKVGARDRAQLVVIAYESGLVSLLVRRS
jgi:DNA-binding NarL/FixJ family response regulator